MENITSYNHVGNDTVHSDLRVLYKEKLSSIFYQNGSMFIKNNGLQFVSFHLDNTHVHIYTLSLIPRGTGIVNV